MKLYPMLVQLLLGLLVASTLAAAEEPGRIEGVIGATGGLPVSNALSTNMENFIIHLEPGERFDRNDGPSDHDRQPRDKPLRGAKP